MHSSMRWAHTLTCMRSRRWGREGSNGSIQSAQWHRGCTCVHTNHAVLPAWGSFTITARVLSSSHNSRDSLLHPYCPRVALAVAAYIPLAHGISCHCHVSIEKCWPSLTFSVLRPLLRGFIIKKLSSCWASGKRGTQIQTVLSNFCISVCDVSPLILILFDL